MAEASARALEHALAEHLDVATRSEALLPRVAAIAQLVVDCFSRDGRVYTFGNGGSALDANHFAEELVGRYQRERRPLPAQSLAVDSAALTCIANDYSFEEVFERPVRAFARAGDLVVAFSTSGRSQNIVRGLAAAKEAGATTILFGSGEGGPALAHADHAILVPSESTARIQELHVFFLHLIVDQVDRWAAGE